MKSPKPSARNAGEIRKKNQGGASVESVVNVSLVLKEEAHNSGVALFCRLLQVWNAYRIQRLGFPNAMQLMSAKLNIMLYKLCPCKLKA